MAIAVSELVIFLFNLLFVFNFPFVYARAIAKYKNQESEGEKKTINPSVNENEMISDLRM